MKTNLEEINSPTIERTRLLDAFMKKNLSQDTQLMISKVIKNSNDKEKKAKEMREMIETCKTEQEVIEKLNSL